MTILGNIFKLIREGLQQEGLDILAELILFIMLAPDIFIKKSINILYYILN